MTNHNIAKTLASAFKHSFAISLPTLLHNNHSAVKPMHALAISLVFALLLHGVYYYYYLAKSTTNATTSTFEQRWP